MKTRIFGSICTANTATGKAEVQISDELGVMPNVEGISKFTTTKEGIYQIAKELSATNVINYFAERPTERLKNYQDMMDDILEGYETATNNFLEKDSDVRFRSAINALYKWDGENGKFRDSSIFQKYNKELEMMKDEDPAGFEYFGYWMQFLHQPPRLVGIFKNISEQLLKQSVSGALMNTTQLTQTILPNMELKYYPGMINNLQKLLFRDKATLQELKDIGIGERVNIEEIKAEKTPFDIFRYPELFNQGVAYLYGKQKALDEGMSEEDAILEGKKFNEKVNFIPRPGNMPQAYWDPTMRNNLVLMSYSINANKMHFGSYINLIKGLKSGDTDAVRKSSAYLVKYYLLNALLYGASSTIPQPLWWSLPEETKKWFIETDKGALFQKMGVDIARNLRPGISNITPVTFNIIDQLGTAIQGTAKIFIKELPENGIEALYEPKSLVQYSKLAKLGLIIAPAVSPQLNQVLSKTTFGGGQLGEMFELAARTGTGYYTRTDYETHKKYESSFWEEVIRILATPRSTIEKIYDTEE